MQLSRFDLFAWATGFIGLLLVLSALFARRRARSFPLFTLFIANQLATTLVMRLLYLHSPFSVFQDWYWTLGILGEALELLVIWEIASHVFRPTGTWALDVRRTVIGIASASAVVAFLLSWLAEPAAPRPIQTFMMRNNFFSAALMSELFVAMVVLSNTFGLPWKTHAARIAQGLGTFSIVSVVLDIVANVVGLSREQRTYVSLSRVRIGIYLACEFYWGIMLWAEAPAQRELPQAMKNQIYTLQRQVENDLIRIRSWRRN